MIGRRIQTRAFENLDADLHSNTNWRLTTRVAQRLQSPGSFLLSVRLNSILYVRMYWILRMNIQRSEIGYTQA